nr:probable membrane-associated kinase regulator 2 [Tanacetum cinerariifolium]
MSNSSGDSVESACDVNVSVSPSDELFFKGGFIPVEESTFKQQSRVSKSATKFRVMMLKLKKLKSNIAESEEEKKVEEVPIVSLFKRHNSSKTIKKSRNEDTNVDEKKFTKEAMQKYLRKVKPLYVRVSKRYGEKMKFSGQLNVKNSEISESKEAAVTASLPEESKQCMEGSEPPLMLSNGNGKGLRQSNLPATLRVVCKHLGKSRSGGTAVVAAAPPGTVLSQRRDDSLLQQQDGIQSAILHCKRSFKASRDSDCSSGESASANSKCVDGSPVCAADGEETVVNESLGLDLKLCETAELEDEDRLEGVGRLGCTVKLSGWKIKIMVLLVGFSLKHHLLLEVVGLPMSSSRH